MTDELKDILIAKMLDAPRSLTDEEVELIMRDDELREIYQISAEINRASAPMPEIDTEAEWARFRPRIMGRPSLTRRFMRVAAIFLGVIFASSILVRLVDHLLTSENPPMTARYAEPAEAPIDTVRSQEIPDSISEPEIIPPARKTYRRPAPETLLASAEDADQAVDLDIDEYLRVQQARIDNDLAMQNAEILIDEYAALRLMYDGLGENDEYIENTIQSLTIQ